MWKTDKEDDSGIKLAGKRILLTGGTGTLGKSILSRAKRHAWGAEFIIFSRDETKQGILRQQYPEHKYILGDISRYNDLKRAMRGVDIVVHLAAYKQVPSAQNNVAATIETNVYGSQQVVEAAIDMGVAQVVTTSTDKACLDWFSRVQLEDGTSKPIGDLVRKKYSGNVITIDPITKERKISKVIGWHKNKLAGRKRYKVSYKSAYLHTGKMSGAIVTEDHPVLTTQGWVLAGNLSDEMLLITDEPEPNFKQYGLIIGTTLGDSSLQGGRRSALILGHAEDQLAWLYTKINALQGFSFGKMQVTERKDGRQRFYSIRSKRYATLGHLQNEIYPEGKQCIPKELVMHYFSPQMMAAWFMDDGCISQNNGGKSRPSARLATHAYNREDVEWLSEFLSSKGLFCNPLDVKVSSKTYTELRFTVEGTQNLFDFIRPGIIPEMSSKIDVVEYDPTFWELGKAEQFIDHPVIREYSSSSRDVYCLDVEDTHTFISGGIVVHNCAPDNAYGVGKKLVEYIFQDANKYGATSFHITRYGNVLASNQSVAVLWEKQLAEGKPLTITDRRMTRFFLSIDDAINLVLLALETDPGTIVVPKAPAISMYAFAQAMAGDREIVDIGLRPGEKIHEAMVSEAESFYTEVTPDYFFIHPPTSSYRNPKAPFSYTSDRPKYKLYPEELLDMLVYTHTVYGV